MSELSPAAAERVRELVDRGVELWTENDELCFLAPPDLPAAAIGSTLRPVREDLIALLAGGERLTSALLIERVQVEHAGGPNAIRTLTFEISGPLNHDALQAALTALVARHDALRTAYPRIGGGRVRLVRPPMPVAVPCLDEEPGHPPRPDPGRPPLLTAALMRRGPEAHLLVLIVHTIAVDGLSLALLVDELGSLYDAAGSGRPPSMPAAPSSGRQVRRERAYLASPDADAAREYWADRLAAAPALPRRPGALGTAGSIPLVLPERLANAVRARAAAEGTTAFTVLLAAYATLLAEVTGGDDITVAVPLGKRCHPEDEHTVSGARDLLLLRLALAGTAPDAIAVAHRERLAAMAHGNLPFDALPPDVAPPRRPGRNRVFDVVFVLQTFGERLALRLRGASVTLRRLPPFLLDAGVGFGLILWDQDGGFRGELACDGSAADAEELPAVGRRYLAILGELADLRVGRIPPEEVRDRLQADPTVADAVLDEREGRVIAYVVLRARADPAVTDRLRRGLSTYHPAPLLVPVARIPRHADGGADLTALRAVPVTDPATLARWEAELAARAGTAVAVEVVPRDDDVAVQEVTATMPAGTPENVPLLDRFGTKVVPRATRPG
ncbi:condensation domain-containing protein [Actinomadura sp. DC4]|uniref:condensation domain-containing protein n=1 Tax=Actinomadura sp. DC4 TaxID=3055069 RepID=UPI0025B0C853|nr:condensation domain-containing protein [Actinomadura sp. DC4]MDN3359631.1 condensation domain-containing protein [Actinomadura sp. DC4]